MNKYEKFMNLAIYQAKKALAMNEVPIGCVIIKDGVLVGSGYNQRNTKKNTLYHAEIIAINNACKVLGDWRLEGCQMFVTIEPCAMCAGAILQARVKELVFGAFNSKAGCCGSILNILNNPLFNHQVNVVSGVLQQKASDLMSNFFNSLRIK